jgi:threonine-phosphate decarboxylase
MKWRAHGANPEKLYAQFGIKMPDNFLDFSTNTNVLQPSPDIGIDFYSLISEYPDDESRELVGIISKNNNVDAHNVLVTNGSNEAIYILVYMYKKVAIYQPTYGEYGSACAAYAKHAYNIFSIEQIQQGTELLIICNPNNPTGKYLSAEKVEEMADECALKGIDLLIDEAYIDFVLPEHNAIDISAHKNIYILRSMTKIYNLAGIRLGYVLADKDKIIEIKKRQPTWSVNAVAQKLGACFLRDDGFLNETKDYYKAETARLKDAIASMGYKVMPSDTHYFLMETDDDEALIRYMLNQGIVLRHTRNFAGLDGRYVRICTREREANDRLVAALGSIRRACE